MPEALKRGGGEGHGEREHACAQRGRTLDTTPQEAALIVADIAQQKMTLQDIAL